MIPKIIHLCWFSGDKFPVEIKVCVDSWKRILPDFEIRLWTYDDAKAIGCAFIDEALQERKWAFAADAVRFYAVHAYGGVYMDSDIFIRRRFDKFIPDKGFATFHEHIGANLRLQAAFFMGEAGNAFCKDVFEHYRNRHFRNPDGSLDMTISPIVMLEVAEKFGYAAEDTEQRLDNDTLVFPGHFVTPCSRGVVKSPDAFAEHRIYGSWRKRKLGRRIELKIKHAISVTRYFLFKR